MPRVGPDLWRVQQAPPLHESGDVVGKHLGANTSYCTLGMQTAFLRCLPPMLALIVRWRSKSSLAGGNVRMRLCLSRCSFRVNCLRQELHWKLLRGGALCSMTKAKGELGLRTAEKSHKLVRNHDGGSEGVWGKRHHHQPMPNLQTNRKGASENT